MGVDTSACATSGAGPANIGTPATVAGVVLQVDTSATTADLAWLAGLPTSATVVGVVVGVDTRLVVAACEGFGAA